MEALAVFRILYGKKIVVSGGVIDPVIWCDHDVRIQGRDDVVDHIFLGQPQLSGMDPV